MTHIRDVIVTCMVLLHVTNGRVQQAIPPAVWVDPSECRSLVDLYIVIDGSDSISYPDFATLKDAVASLIPQIDIAPNKARIGMLVYSSTVPLRSEHPFSDNPVYLQNAAMTLQHPRDGTNTALGIQHMRKMFRLHGRANVPKVCVVITDGISKNAKATKMEATLAKEEGVTMIAVGIGALIDQLELGAIASTTRQVFKLDYFSQLQDRLRGLMTTICPCPVPAALELAKCNSGPRAIGSVREYQCLDGYLQRGNPVITCLDTSTWTPISLDFQCVPCSTTTPVIQHGSCGGGAVTLGTQRSFVCDTGYLGRGDPNILCQNDATWSIPTFECVPCGPTPDLLHGKCGGGEYTIGARRQFVCDPGYLAVGDPSIMCRDDATWSLSQFQCIPCGPTPDLLHGKCGGGDYTLGARRLFTCDPGYLAVGDPNIVCQNDATWSISQFQCRPCGVTPDLLHGSCGGGDSIIGARRQFVCDAGYLAVGDPNIICLDNAEWSLPSFQCMPCGPTPALEHGSCGDGTFTLDSRRQYVCEPGYLPVGDPNIICQPNAEWSLPNFQCKPCGMTPEILNGKCGGGAYTLGAMRQFVCDPGYLAVGDPNILCQPNAEWSLPSFQCNPCGPTPDLLHGKCGGGEYTLGAMRQFVCDPGYLAVGDPNIMCQPNAEWSLPTFQCKPCGPTPDLLHGTCGGGEYTLGAMRQFVCDPGYLAVGDPSILCQPNAEWSLPTFQCIPCGPTPTLLHGQCGDGASILGSTRQFTCQPGYLPVGDPTIRCLDNAQWSNPTFQCKPCGPTPDLLHGKCGGGEFTLGTMRQFTCDPGYLAVGDPSIMCQPNAEWSLPNFQCKPCGPTPDLLHGKCGGGDYTLGAMRQFVCDPGYLAVGDPSIMCQPNAEWSLPTFQCMPCGPTPDLLHGKCGGGEYTLGAMRQFVCDPGYLAVGDPNIVCQDNAEWSLSSFQCNPCGPTPTLLHGTCGNGDVTIGSTRQFACEPGYLPVGDPIIRCLDNAQWSIPSYECKPCGPTPELLHGSCGGDDYRLGAVRTYTCAPGYAAIGDPIIRCLDDASWSAPTFQCVPCGDTPDVLHAQCGAGDALVGSRRTYTCGAGFLSMGNPSIECLPTGQWSVPAFECKDCGAPPMVMNAYAQLGPSAIGGVRDYYCESGYKMFGHGQITCLANGQWEQPTFVCNVITTTTTTTPAPIPENPSVCDACRMMNGVGFNRHPYDCNQFVQCFIGTRGMEPVYRKCPFGEFWDQDILTCRPSHDVYCPHDKCTSLSAKGYKHTDPNDCCSYWRCDRGKSFGDCCGAGFTFSPVSGQCMPNPQCAMPCQYVDELPACDKRPGLTETMFKQHIGAGHWVDMHCAPGTAFNPVDCQCSLHLMNIPGKRRQQVCKPEVYLPFTHGFEDRSGKNVYIQPMNVSIMNGAAFFNGHARLMIHRFANAEFHGDFVVKFRYRELLEGPTATNLQALVSNGGCDSDPSVIIAKMPGYVLLGAKTDVPKSFALPTLDKEWKEVIYIHNEETLEGRVCGASKDKWSWGPVQATNCAMNIGYGEGLDNYMGLIDDLFVYQCRPRASILNIDY